jgi:hypothetical protein
VPRPDEALSPSTSGLQVACPDLGGHKSLFRGTEGCCTGVMAETRDTFRREVLGGLAHLWEEVLERT